MYIKIKKLYLVVLVRFFYLRYKKKNLIGTLIFFLEISVECQMV